MTDRGPFYAAVSRTTLALALVFGSSPSVAGPAKPVWPCHWVSGRLTIGNGTPSVRIRPQGTHRLLGVVNPAPGGGDAGDLATLPRGIGRMLAGGRDGMIRGEFHVCPVEPERAGRMRSVILDAARDLTREPH